MKKPDRYELKKWILDRVKEGRVGDLIEIDPYHCSLAQLKGEFIKRVEEYEEFKEKEKEDLQEYQMLKNRFG